MGDRFNPIKFGPEWLRKLSREPSTTAGNGSGRESADPTPGAALPVSPGAAPPGMSLQPQRPNSNPNASANSNTSKVHLAKLRYGREEMLALYDKNTVEAPSQLKTVEALYWQKPKPPYALNIFEDKMRDIRGQHTLGGDRFGVARGRGVSADNRVRIPSVSEARGRSRLYNRPTPSVARGGGWHGMPTKNPHMTDEDASLKSWTNNNSLSGLRPNAEQVDWANKPAYRTKRPTNTNWRQTSREEGEEWRSSDTRRPEKWDREWPERSSQEKTWHVNRRTWVGGETADDSLPEWAVENSEACAGTFDSSGAFHGYSNDDTNLPKSTAEPYVLARSQTHGNFTRSKTVDEGSDEWWASEKAKKLSPKRFDASEIKFKKPSSSDESEPKPEKNSGGRLSYSTTSGASGGAPNEMTNSPLNAQISTPAKDVNEPTTAKLEPNKANTFSKNAEEWQSQSKPFDPQTAETPTDDQGNFQSVMMPTKNMLRQKHQNIGTPTDSPVKQQSHNMRYFMDSFTAKQPEPNEDKEKDKIVDEMLQLNLDADNMPLNQLLGNRPNPGMSAPLSMPAPAIPQNQGSQMNPTPHSQYTPVQGAAAANKSFGGMNVTNTAIPPQSVPAQPPTAINVQNKVGSLQPANAQNTQAGLASGLQPGGGLAGHLTSSAARGLPFQSGGALPNVANNNSLFMGQRPTGPIPNPGDMVNQVLPPHIQRSSPAYDNPFYSNMMQQMPQPMPSVGPNLSELWYYEDPNNTIQGPFTTSEMLHWYRAGFFHHTLMIRRANEVHMSPLGTYGPHPFGSVDMPVPYQMGPSGFDMRPQQANLMHPQPGLGLNVPNSMGMPTMPFVPPSHVTYDPNNPNHLNIRVAVAPVPPFRVGMIPVNQIEQRPLPPPIPMPIPHIPEPIPMPETIKTFGSLWSPPSSNLQELLWIHNRQAVENSLPPNPNIGPNYFPDYLPPQLPMVSHEDITKDMRTEDDILAQIRANQPPRPASSISTLFHDEEPVPVLEDFTANADLNMQELQKLIQRDDGDVSAPPLSETEPMQDRPDEIDENGGDILKTSQSKPAESKLGKFAKVEDKSKDQAAKPKPKKIKDEKKEDSADGKPKDCESKSEKRSNESSPSAKSKKDDKVKKELEKEKKEWLKEGFTIVKSAEKNKDKKKSDEVKAAEEAERKRKEEEKAEQDLRKRQIETLKKQQEIQNQQQQQAARQAELMSRKAPWSAPNQTIASSYPGPTLAEIQRLEREKKLEQMKQQQQMMQIIAQQQQAALAREQAFGGQELQGGVGWLKNQASNTTTQNQSLAEIQAEARKACVAAAAAAAAAREEAPPKPTATPINIVPWGNTAHNGAGAAAPVGGFWDTAPEQPKVAKAVEPKPVEVKPKKKVVVVPPPKNPHKKDASPSADFDTWCTNALGIWRDSNIDVPTFISFLRDIESPYEVKDYVKCYLGDTKDSNDFARQFLERRSRLLRVGMVTPSDDLCSPAIAINPRTISGSGSYDYTNVKGKPKKIKKNKMLKVDARNILGFSVTASEDRINVGDIDTV